MLRALIKKAGNMLEQTGNISRELETLRSNGMEMLEIRNSVMEKMNAFDGLNSSLDTAK